MPAPEPAGAALTLPSAPAFRLDPFHDGAVGMRVLEAAKLVRAGVFPTARLWLIATKPERVQLALLLGRPEELPADARTPGAAWKALNVSERRLVLRHAPPAILARLPGDPASGRRMVWKGRLVNADREAAELAA